VATPDDECDLGLWRAIDAMDDQEFFEWTGRLDQMLAAMVERVKAEGPVLTVPLWRRDE
jgi:hypothetical protein